MGIVEILFGTKYERQLRRFANQIRKAGSVALADVPEAMLVRVTGHAIPIDGRVLDAPLSGRRCLFYRASVFRHTAPNQGNTYDSVREIATEQQGVPFLIENDGTRALVDTAEARLLCVFDHTSESLAAYDASPQQRALLVRHDQIQKNIWFTTHHLEYKEAIIEVGERVTLCGYAMREPDPDGGVTGEADYRTSAGGMRLRFSGTPKVPLLVTDDPVARRNE